MALSQIFVAARVADRHIAFLFAALCLLFIIMGIFNTDPVILTEAERRTFSGNVHILAAMLAIALFNTGAIWTAIKTGAPIFLVYSIALPLTTLAFLGTILAAMHGKKQIFGYFQRANIAIATLWQISVALAM
jgi:hypothetical protein